MQLNNQVAVISGGASGLGLATAMLFLEHGMRVVVLDNNEERLNQIDRDYDIQVFHVDVTQASAVEETVHNIVINMGSIDVNVNCAGVAPPARIVSKMGPQPLQAFEEVVQINLVGTFNVLRVIADQMIKQEPLNEDGERGVIINTASIAAFDGQIGQAGYAASKGGIVAMTLPLAREMAQFGVRVMTIAPGIMQTPLMDVIPGELQAGLHASVPFPQRMGIATEFAELACHIVKNPYLNAEVIRLDGGLRMAAK